MNFLGSLIAVCSAVLVILFIALFLFPKGNVWHRRIGYVFTGIAVVALILSIWRGIDEYHLPHGPLYGVHMFFGSAFIVCAIAIGLTGRKLQRATEAIERIRYENYHAGSVILTGLFLFMLLVVGVASSLLPRVGQ